MESVDISPVGSSNMQIIDELRKRFSGKLSERGDVDYEVARKVWNGMIDKYPLLIATCKKSDDVIQCVNFARQNELPISIKAGGHNVTGYAVCDDGLVIDLSEMASVKVDPEKQEAVVEAGATWAEFDTAAQQYGLATTGGVVASTGVAGLTLGGGVGWLVRKHGLSCDNLLEVQLVTADGKLVTANAEENSELFWGVRGCGTNFGVVTTMKFKLHKVGLVLAGIIAYPQTEAKEVLQFYREFVRKAPEEITLYANLTTSPDGFPIIALAGLFSGDLEKGEALIKQIREFKTPVLDLVQPMPYVQMQSMLEPAFPHGHRYYWKSSFLKDLSDEAIDVITSNVAKIPSPFSCTILEFYGGASSREPEGGTAYPHRQSEFDLVVISNWQSTQDDEKNINWTRNLYEAIQPFSSHRVYVNALGKEGQDRVKEAYGPNYDRLLALKRKYDPNNLFRLNQNIVP
ncbi:MAG: 6-hydroxy-D-nicotine oxidase [Segetibacter sp.]|nr:6-hydroxy-D-nicotine oxidase [Segetibacter sp.]